MDGRESPKQTSGASADRMAEQSDSNDENTTNIGHPRELWPDIFRPLDAMVDAVEGWVHAVESVPEDPLNNLKIGMSIRAVNILKCVKLLAGGGHWEDVAILTRSIFELLLHLEEVLRDPNSQQQRAARFIKYGRLQEYLHAKANAEYDVARRRFRGDTAQLRELDKLTLDAFPEFLEKSKDKRKPPRWARSWCDKSVKQLASDSANQMRPHQYALLYRFTSDMVHSSPLSLTGATHLGMMGGKTDEEILARDKAKMTEFVTMAVMLCGEIVMLLGDTLPGYDPTVFLRILNMVFELYGVDVSTQMEANVSND